MGQLPRTHPLDRLIDDDSLFFLEAMIPFVDSGTKKMLVILIKFKELTAIMNSLSNPSYLSERGFNCHPKNTDELILGMCDFMPEGYKSSITQMQQMMTMMKVMNSMEAMKEDSFSGDTSACERPPYGNPSCEGCVTQPENTAGLFDSIMSIIDDGGY